MADKKLTEHLANLSKLSFTDEELSRVTDEMTDIIALMDMVQEIDRNQNTFTLPAVDYDSLRTDNADKSFDTQEIIRNAKTKTNNAFTVPKVV
ncbi:MAG: Asp-tRNA(Asn)/Glu-tRNA(Gln) amidotransferase subunit GatC [Eubacteriales bacterium]|nr:Asp-tRNA(Asn)/Glu-tRNA(Gln) amidotransferase subunit GatC [Eubacteriales bacterium]